MNLGGALIAGSALVAAGMLAALWPRLQGRNLVALPAAAAGAAIAMAGVARFGGSPGPGFAAGQEMAILILVAALAGTVLGAAYARGERTPADGGRQRPRGRRR